MEGLTPDSVERALQEEESKVAPSRAKQLQLILVADAMQLQTADGCRSLTEWVAGRIDVSRETASSLVRTARRSKTALAPPISLAMAKSHTTEPKRGLPDRRASRFAESPIHTPRAWSAEMNQKNS